MNNTISVTEPVDIVLSSVADFSIFMDHARSRSERRMIDGATYLLTDLRMDGVRIGDHYIGTAILTYSQGTGL